MNCLRVLSLLDNFLPDSFTMTDNDQDLPSTKFDGTLFNREVVPFYDETEHREITATMKDVENQFSDRKIRKMINDYMLNPDSRFKVIKITVEIPKRNNIVTEKEVILQMKGKKIMSNSIPQELVRPMTVTDLLYLAAVDSCEKRHAMISRYPLGTDKGIYFSKIRVQSTAKHIKLIFNGKEYPFYPDIDLSIPTDHVGVQFIDTLVLSNSHLDGMGADYDGDTLSVRGIWTDEANLEAEKIMNKKVLIVDDVISTGESLRAVEELVHRAGGNIVGKMAPLAEGDAAKRSDITFLTELPLFNSNGEIL